MKILAIITKKQSDKTVLIGFNSNPLNIGFDTFAYVSKQGAETLAGTLEAGTQFNIECNGVELVQLHNVNDEPIVHADGTPVYKAVFK